MAQSDSLFGIHAAALRVQSQRMELISANIANADTPGFKARDVDFRSVLAAVRNEADQMTPSQDAQSAAQQVDGDARDPLYRVPMQPSADGNTVDLQVEQSQFADAALRYQASLQFIDGRIRQLTTAITGQ